MSIKSLGSDGWMVDLRPQGRDGKRVRKKFPTKAEAQHFERWVIATQNNKDWIEKPTDRRRLSELIELWWTHHGQTLTDGVSTKRKLVAIDKLMGYPTANQITPATFSDYRAMRLEAGKTANTINHDQDWLSGVFGALIRLGFYHGDNPLSNFKKLKMKTSEMGFLHTNQINELLDLLSGDSLLVTKVCLATGGRWSEIANLKREYVSNSRITFTITKSGSNRTVPISKELFAEITKGTQRLLFPSTDYETVRGLIKQVAPDLPKGQAVHVLRHTFASHFMMNGGNILALQKILGHSTINQTMVYAHFSPDHLRDAVTFNPLNNYKSSKIIEPISAMISDPQIDHIGLV